MPRVLADAPPSFSTPGKTSGSGVGVRSGGGVGSGGGDGVGSGSGVGVGVGVPVRSAIELLSAAVATLEPHRLTGGDAARLYGLYAEVERLSMAAKTLLAPRIDDSGVWRDGGHRSPAVMLAELEGVPVGQARNTLEVGRRLPELPGTEEALRSGTLSGPKVTELSGAAVLDPDMEASLLAGAADAPLHTVKDRCHRARVASAGDDPLAATRRVHGNRHFSSWFDGEGAFCFKGRDTADRGAKVLAQLRYTVSQLRKADQAAQADSTDQADRADHANSTDRANTTDSEPNDRSEPDRALQADAFFLLVTGRTLAGDGSTVVDDDDPGPPDEHISRQLDTVSGVFDRPITAARGTPPPASGKDGTGKDRTGSTAPRLPVGPDGAPTGPERDVIDRPPTCSLVVRVDLDALLRGQVEAGEACEIDNQGPIPVAMARDLASDSYLRLVFHRSGDIRAVSHFGRTINARLRTALAHRDRHCVVPGCGVPYGLEIDHVIPFAQGGPTALDNLALLCHHHHYLKTYEGWTLERTGIGDDGSPTWAFTPMPEFGQEPDLGL